MIMADDPNWRHENARKGRQERTWRKQCRWAEEMRADGWTIQPPQGKKEYPVMNSITGES